jgi:hypothetical protein
LASLGLTSSFALAKHEAKGEDAAVVSDRLLEAQVAKQKAEKAFDEITRKLLSAVDHDSTYGAAQREADASQAKFDALNDSALSSLKNDPAYKAEVAARDSAKAELDRAHLLGQATDEEKTDMAKAVMNHNTAIHKMEADAAKNVPGLSAARGKAMTAQAQLAKVKERYMKQVSENPQWTAAKAAMEETHRRVTDAEEAVARVPDKNRGPITRQPIVAQPRNIQPVNKQPVVAQPVDKQPVVAQPVDKQPVVAQPVDKQPVNAQPVDKQPVVAQPIPGGPPNN